MESSTNIKSHSQVPSWLTEITNNQDLEQLRFVVFNSYCRFAFIEVNSDTIHLYTSLPSTSETLQNKSDRRVRIAFFRDGPFLMNSIGAACGSCSTGAATSMLGMMEALVENGYDVFLFYCFRGSSDPKLYLCKRFSTVFIRSEDFYANTDLMTDLIRSYSISICQFDSAEATCWQARFAHRAHARVVFEVHNVESTLMIQRSASYELITYFKDKEAEAMAQSDLVLCRSTVDLSEMQQLNTKNVPIQLYRGCISLTKVKLEEDTAKLTGNILFLGNINYGPNIEAVGLIVRKIAPHIQGNCYIVGMYPQSLKSKWSDQKNIVLLGWVEDLSTVFSKADIGIAPILSGSGTSLKILDYMAHHLPVIGTELSICGLDNSIRKSMIVENDIDKYAEIINRLLAQPSFLADYAKRAYSFVREQRNWETGISDVIQAYANILTGGHDPLQIFISLEGMPRSGKSTTFNRIINEWCYVVDHSDEIYFTSEYESRMTDPWGTVEDSIWFLCQEAERLKKSNASSGFHKPVLLVDRCYLTTLAYAFARAKFKNDPEEFGQVEKHFFQNRTDYPRYKVIFVFDIDVLTSIERRKNKPAPGNELWSNVTFMSHFRNFYQEELYKYTNGTKIIHLKSDDLSLEQLYTAVQKTLNELLYPLVSANFNSSQDDRQNQLTTDMDYSSEQQISEV